MTVTSRKAHSDVDVLVIGAGITGCAAAHELQARGIDYLLIEKNTQPGGLSRSISLGDAQFDYTGHFLHLQRYDTPAAIPYANLNDADWQRVDRRSGVYMDGQLMPAPFQYNLSHLPAPIRQRCLDGFRNRRIIDRPASFGEHLLASFGEGICSSFLFPYNEKLMACELGRLTPESAGRFLPPPDPALIEDGVRDAQSGEYNSRFWYPKRRGIGLLADGLASGLPSLRLGCPITRIDPIARQAQTPMGAIAYRRMLSSIPLKELCASMSDERLRALGHGLSHNRVASINLLAKGRLPKELSNTHWVYLPERKYPFYRVGLHSNVAALVPDGFFSMCAEVAAMPGVDARMSDLVGDAVECLSGLGWLERGSVEAVAANWIDCAYVHFTHDRQARVAGISKTLAEYGVVPMGRYGTWDYTSMEDCIRQGIDAARMVAEG